jgi:two-component system, NarL family, response regulator DevR
MLASYMPGLLSGGLTNKQIADRMFPAEKTVKNYVSLLLAKLGMECRTQTAVFATKLERPPQRGDR